MQKLTVQDVLPRNNYTYLIDAPKHPDWHDEFVRVAGADVREADKNMKIMIINIMAEKLNKRTHELKLHDLEEIDYLLVSEDIR